VGSSNIDELIFLYLIIAAALFNIKPIFKTATLKSYRL